MAMQTVEFQFITGLKRAIFRNARLRGSWDGNGRYADFWTDSPVQERMGRMGVPFLKPRFHWTLPIRTGFSSGESSSTDRRAPTSGCPGRIIPSVTLHGDIIVSHTTASGSRDAILPRLRGRLPVRSPMAQFLPPAGKVFAALSPGEDGHG